MSINVFHPEDEIDNLLRGLSLLEMSLEGLASRDGFSDVEPEELEVLVMTTQALQDHVQRIQEIVGCVVFKSPVRAAPRLSPVAVKGKVRRGNGRQSASQAVPPAQN
jgi:hypothetical protein